MSKPKWFSVVVRDKRITAIGEYYLDPTEPEGLFKTHLGDTFKLVEEPFPRYVSEVGANAKRVVTYVFMSEGIPEAHAAIAELEKIER